MSVFSLWFFITVVSSVKVAAVLIILFLISLTAVVITIKWTSPPMDVPKVPWKKMIVIGVICGSLALILPSRADFLAITERAEGTIIKR